MKKLDNELLKNKFLDTVKQNIGQCVYLAIDLETYGLDDPNVTFYYDEIDGELETLIMKYYDSIQMFSPNYNWDEKKYVEFIKSLSPIAVCARKDIIQKLENHFTEYFPEYGIVIADNKYMEFKQFNLVRQAEPGDARRIAELMYSSNEFRQNNTLDVLEKQLYDRMKSGLGRSFIIEEDGIIVAHTAIYAECGNVAIESGLVVHEDYKRKFYGMIIHEYIKKKLSLESKTLYGIRYNDNMQTNAKKEKLDIRAECGRLILKNKGEIQ